MFVSTSKHQATIRKANAEIMYLLGEYRTLAAKWSKLVDRVNKAGGEAIFDRPAANDTQFTPDEISTLIRLCHPDRHDGKESAVRMTQKLLQLRNKS